MPTQRVSQAKWLKGIVATSQKFAQPKGSFPRGSNIEYTKRGGLITCDGSLTLSSLASTVQRTAGTGVNGGEVGTSWVNPQNVASSSLYATNTLNTVGTSASTRPLFCSLFGFSLPTSEVITGIQVDIEMFVSSAILSDTITAQLLTAGGVVGTAKVSATLTNTTVATLTFGGAGDVWSAGLAASDINQLGFGVSLTGNLSNAHSSIVFSIRRVRITVYGTNQVIAFDPATNPLFKEIFLFEPSASPKLYYALVEDPTQHLPSTPGTPVLTLVTSANPPAAGTYYFQVTALDGAGGETGPPSQGSIVADGTHGIQVAWTAVPHAFGYNVYWNSAAANGFLVIPAGVVVPNPTEYLGPTVSGQAVTTYLFDTTSQLFGAAIQAPLLDTTQQCLFVQIPILGQGWTRSSPVFIFPADNIVYNPSGGGGGPGGGGGGTGVAGTGVGGGTTVGGVVGNVGPIPQIVQFQDKMILALSNGVPPYSSDGTNANTAPLTNTFQATYPARANSTVQAAGDMIAVTVSAVPYIFKCIQGGTTASGAPTFTAVLNRTVADGSVIWENIGPVPGVVAPRGAAHVIVYAGSLWIWNTYPSNTADNLDGPSCLAMSDLNNPGSWNPLNRAFLDKDDGSQGMGLATFTIAEAGIPPTGSLVAFKEFSTFQINGVFGASNFSIQRAQTDLGCIAPRTISFVPGYGIVRLTHLGIAVFDGVRDRLLSEEIRPYLFGGESDIVSVDWNFAYFSKGAQSANPPMYLMAAPLVTRNLTPLIGSSVFTTALGIGATLPAGTYYARVTLKSPLYESQVSEEFGPLTIVAGQGLAVTTPALPSGYLGYRVYFGALGPGQENQYVDLRDASSGAVNIVALGTAGNPPTGIVAAMTRVFCYDLVLKAWTIIDLPFSISVLKQFRSPGQQPVTISGGFSDATMRRLFSGDQTWDGVPVNASVRTPEVFGQAASDNNYFRRIVIRGTGSPTSLAAQVTTQGQDGAITSTYNFVTQVFGDGQFEAYVDIALVAMNAYMTLSWTGTMEVDSVDWFVAKKARVLVMAG